MASSADEPKEMLWPSSGYVFEQEFLLPAYCKPKLIPLKSVTLEKLEKMQAENANRLRAQQQEREEEKQTDTEKVSDTKTDFWRAAEEEEAGTGGNTATVG